MGKRLQGIAVGIAIGVLLMGGVAYAVTPTPPSPTDRYYACVSPRGAVEYRTVRLNRKPPVAACADPADTIRSWNAQGPKGDRGPAATPQYVPVPHKLLSRDPAGPGDEVASIPLVPGDYMLSATLMISPVWGDWTDGDFRQVVCAAWVLPSLEDRDDHFTSRSMTSTTLMRGTRFAGVNLPMLAPVHIGGGDTGVSIRCWGTLMQAEQLTVEGTAFVQTAALS